MRVIDDLGEAKESETPVRVLVLEDDRVEQTKLARMLELAKMEPICAGSLISARAALAEQEFDAAVIDVQLPDGSGLTMVPMLHGGERPCACVVLTGSDDHGVVRQAVELGVTQFLRKPASPHRVRQALSMALHRSRTMRSWLDDGESVSECEEVESR